MPSSPSPSKSANVLDDIADDVDTPVNNDSDNDMDTPQFDYSALLSSAEKANKKLATALPVKGTKDFAPDGTDGSDIQKQLIESSIGALITVIKDERKSSAKTLSTGVWLTAHNLAVVTSPKSSHYQRMGRNIGTKLYLLPEETLYLLEKGAIHLTLPSSDLDQSGVDGLSSDGLKTSVQMGFDFVLEQSKFPRENYQVYSYMKRLGYIVTRAGYGFNKLPPECGISVPSSSNPSSKPQLLSSASADSTNLNSNSAPLLTESPPKLGGIRYGITVGVRLAFWILVFAWYKFVLSCWVFGNMIFDSITGKKTMKQSIKQWGEENGLDKALKSSMDTLTNFAFMSFRRTIFTSPSNPLLSTVSPASSNEHHSSVSSISHGQPSSRAQLPYDYDVYKPTPQFSKTKALLTPPDYRIIVVSSTSSLPSLHKLIEMSQFALEDEEKRKVMQPGESGLGKKGKIPIVGIDPVSTKVNSKSGESRLVSQPDESKQKQGKKPDTRKLGRKNMRGVGIGGLLFAVVDGGNGVSLFQCTVV
ncbi:hypothetical protein BKA69DRAFT_1034835 [Paraphysoderma sedebokerense]|nr:hypothetical protein BKA69DRAFT_1034835 [Paraphysoderma sedebokerense]